MAEDLLLNITSVPVASKKQKLRGGRWIDRLKHNHREARKTKRLEDTASVLSVPVSSGTVNTSSELIKQNDTVSNPQENTVAEDGTVPTHHLRLKRKRAESFPSRQAAIEQRTGGPHGGVAAQKDDRVVGQIVSSIFDFNDPLPVMAPVKKVETLILRPSPSNASLRSSATFEEAGIIPELITTMTEKLKITKPTVIQRNVLSVMTQTSKDLFIRAETGSGKTLAYLLPILNRLCQLSPSLQTREGGCYALLIAPTRELAQQIHGVLNTMLNSRKARWIVGVLLIGGEKKKSEKARLRKGATIVIATPGRLKDHLETTQVLDVTKMRWVVLDEGDRLMDLGFEKTIIDILSTIREREGRQVAADSLPNRRVTVICSATAKENIKSLGEQNLQEAIFIDGVDNDGRDDGLKTNATAPVQLKQEYLVVPTKLRIVTLVAALKKAFSQPKACKKVIVFFSCGDTVDWHFSALSRPLEDEGRVVDPLQPSSISEMTMIATGLKLHKLHGSLPQQIRTQTLFSFTNCSEPAILFCTDVASRGIDIHIDRIIQYDPPFSIDDYTHRIGRTARAGRSGSALLFTLKSEAEYLDLIKSTLKCDLEEVNVKFLLKFGFGKVFEDTATQWQLAYEKWANTAANIDRAKTAFTSHVRAYATHLASERKCFPMHGLQLGHVAKSFGLRDAPSTIGQSLPKHRVKGRGAASERDEKGESQKPTDIQTRMRRVIAAQSSASEFNVM